MIKVLYQMHGQIELNEIIFNSEQDTYKWLDQVREGFSFYKTIRIIH